MLRGDSRTRLGLDWWKTLEGLRRLVIYSSVRIWEGEACNIRGSQLCCVGARLVCRWYVAWYVVVEEREVTIIAMRFGLQLPAEGCAAREVGMA